MKFLNLRLLFSVLFFILVVLFNSFIVFAREATFQIVNDDIDLSNDGIERLVVGDDGALYIYNSDASNKDGFPVFVDNHTIISSPLAVDLLGDSVKEIAVLLRGDDNIVSLYLYNGSGLLIDDIDLGDFNVYYDPVVHISVEGISSIYLVNLDGELFEISYLNDSLSLNQKFDFNKIAGISFSSDYLNLFVNFPNDNFIEVYSFDNDNLVLDHSLNIDNPIIYPVIYYEDFVYAVDTLNNFLAFNVDNAIMKNDFPVVFDNVIVSPPLLLDVNDDNILDFIINLDNSLTKFVSLDAVLFDKMYKKTFSKNNSGVVSNASVFDLRNGVISYFNSNSKITASTWSQIFLAIDTPIMPSPLPIQNLKVEEGFKEMKLTWAEYEESANFDHYNVYRTKDVDGGEIIKLSEIGNREKNFYVDINKQGQGFAYYYAVKAVYKDESEIEDYEWKGPFKSFMRGENIMEDGDMEINNVEKWQRWGHPLEWSKSNSDAYSHKQSMYIDSKGELHAGIQQLNIPVEAGERYILNFKYKHNGEYLKNMLGIQNSNGDYEGVNLELPSTNDKWINYQREFVVPEDFENDFRFRISVYNGEAYIDDVYIEKLPKSEVYIDGNMEMEGVANYKGWGRSTLWEKTQNEVYKGEYSLKIGEGEDGGGVYQTNIEVRPGKTYKYSFWYKVNEDSLYTILGIKSANVDFEGVSTKLTNTNGEWMYYEREFTVPKNFMTPFISRFSTRYGESYIDNVSIKEIEEIVYVEDGDFELEHTIEWKKWGSLMNWGKSDEESYEGIKSMKIGEGEDGGGLYQTNIPVEVNKTYKYSFWYKVNGGSLYTILGIRSANVDFEGISTKLTNTNGEWSYYERYFTVPENFVAPFISRFSTKYGESYIDNVEIEEVKEVKYIQDGGFELAHVMKWKGWGGSMNWHKTNEEAHEGEQSIKIGNGEDGAGLYQTNIPVEANKTYKYSFWYKVNSGKLYTILGIRSANVDFEGIYPKLINTNGEWKYYEREFTVPEDFTSSFISRFSTKHGEVYVDDVKIEELVN